MTEVALEAKPTLLPPQGDQRALVRAIYELHKTLRMNALYYGKRLQQVQRFNLLFGIVLAVFTSSTVASILSSHHRIAVTISLIAAVLSVTKPILALSKLVERYSKIWSAYIALSRETGRVVEDLQVLRKVEPYMEHIFNGVREKFDDLSKRDDDPYPNMKLLLAQKNAVERELPPENFWYPTQSPSQP
jgi:hypothetical protein